jgi:Nucleoside 2-deoxyribosyltransferase like
VDVTVVYAQRPAEPADASIFLAGPTPRDPAVPSWRPAAVEILSRLWSGPGCLAIFVPEAPGGGFDGTWLAQVEWEDQHLTDCDVIAFWLPRSMRTLPGLTTNVEWGRWEASGKVVLGTPPEAEKVKYLLHYAGKHGVPTAHTLEATMEAALELLRGRRA